MANSPIAVLATPVKAVVNTNGIPHPLNGQKVFIKTVVPRLYGLSLTEGSEVVGHLIRQAVAVQRTGAEEAVLELDDAVRRVDRASNGR